MNHIREQMEFDVVIVGAGPAGLAAAIHLKQLAKQQSQEISVCVLEKASEVGAHTLSGAVMDPIALDELLPDWRERGAPIQVEVKEDRFLFLGERSSWQTPSFLLPSCFHNQGNFVVRLSDVVKWLGDQAVELGVDVFAGFAASEVLYDETGAVRGVATGDMGRSKEGAEKPGFQPGMELLARHTLFAEGARGHLGKQLIEKFDLAKNAQTQVYGLGIKEVWQVDASVHQPGLVVHSAGWPLDNSTYGGGFLYHLDQQQVAVGFVVGLGYDNAYLSPFEEFQRYKTHPAIKQFLQGGKRLSYGARAITAGGLQSLPELIFAGGALIGCEAGFLNASRIKGSHAAIKSGVLAAKALMNARAKQVNTLDDYPILFKQSWLYEELHRARNFKPAMSKGLLLGSVLVGIDQLLLRGKAPWTLKHKKADHLMLKPLEQSQPIVYPKPDGVISFDRLSSVFLSNTNHEENQPIHLTLKNVNTPVDHNLAVYGGPESRYCPAGVYEFVETEDKKMRLQINSQNCVHCKTCDIKDPTQNIVWVAPEGGGGPNYVGM